METRTITQVKIYSLHLNPMRANYEKTNLVAIAYDKDQLINWYEGLKTEPYKDENWHKQFQKGTKLEWYNPVEYSEYCGIDEKWTTQEEIEAYVSRTQQSYGFEEVPELIR